MLTCGRKFGLPKEYECEFNFPAKSIFVFCFISLQITIIWQIAYNIRYKNLC